MALISSGTKAESHKLPAADAAKNREERLLKSLHEFPETLNATSAKATGLPRAQRWAMTYDALDVQNDLPKGVCERELPGLAKQVEATTTEFDLTRLRALFILGDLEQVEARAAKLGRSAQDNQIASRAWRLAGYAAAEIQNSELAVKYFKNAAAKTDPAADLESWGRIQGELIHALEQAQRTSDMLEAMRQEHAHLAKQLGESNTRTIGAQNRLAEGLYHHGLFEQADEELHKILAILTKEPEKNASLIKAIQTNLGKVTAAQNRKPDGNALSLPIKKSDEEPGQNPLENLGDDETVASLNRHASVGALYYSQQKFREAAEQFRIVYDQRKRRFGAENSETLDAQNDLGASLHAIGENEEAVKLLSEAVAISERLRSEDSLDTAAFRNNLGISLGALGKHEEAVAMFRKVAKVRQKVLGPQHSKTLDASHNLCTELDDVGKPIEAEKLAREVVAAREATQGPEHPKTLSSRSVLASLMMINGKLQESETEYRSILATSERVFGPNHVETINARLDLAAMLVESGRGGESIELCRAALAASQPLLGEENPLTLRCHKLLAAALATPRNRGEGTAATRRTLAIMLKIHGPDHPETLEARAALATQLQLQNDFAEAAKEYDTVLAAYRRLHTFDSSSALNARNAHANNLRRMGKLAESESNFRPLLKAYTAIMGVDDVFRLNCLSNFGLTLKEQKKYEEALPVFQEYLTKCTKLHGEGFPGVIGLYMTLADVLKGLGRLDESKDYEKKALERSRIEMAAENARRALLRNGASGFRNGSSYTGGNGTSLPPISPNAPPDLSKAISSPLLDSIRH